MMIIHQIWMQGEGQIPQTYREYSRALRTLNPEMEHKVWSDSELERVCDRLGPVYGEAYRASKHMHQKVDFGRYCVIYTYGGISVDMDVKPLKPLGPVVARVPKDKLGVSEFPITFFESTILSGKPQSWWLNNATLIAKTPRNRACGILVDAMAEALLTRTWTTWMPKNVAVTYTTGPMYFMDVFREMDPSLWIMIPSKYLEPCSGYHKTCKIPEAAVLYHTHDGTWLPAWHATGARMYYHLKSNPLHFALCVFVMGLVAAMLRYRVIRVLS